MPTRETEANAGVGPAAKQVAEHASSLARLELELAILELKKKVSQLGIGLGLGAGALLFVVFGLAFVFATIAAGLATAVGAGVALLITTGSPIPPATGVAFLPPMRVGSGTPPLPGQ